MNLINIMDSNLFDSIKVILSLSPRCLEANEIMIRNVQNNFFNNFGLTQFNMKFPIPFKLLFGPCTERKEETTLYLAFLSGETEMLYLNLYHTNGKVLPCHLTLRNLNHHYNIINKSRDTCSIDESLELRAILTIRSACCVGNSQSNGVGLIDINRIYKGYLDNLIGFEPLQNERNNNKNSNKSVK